jgi:hypothetical protein
LRGVPLAAQTLELSLFRAQTGFSIAGLRRYLSARTQKRERDDRYSARKCLPTDTALPSSPRSAPPMMPSTASCASKNDAVITQRVMA